MPEDVRPQIERVLGAFAGLAIAPTSEASLNSWVRERLDVAGVKYVAEATLRDGQKNSVNAYYLLATEGSDPIVADVLGVKRAQVEGIRNPDQDLIEKLDTSGDRVKALAEKYLAKPRKAREGGAVHSLSEARATQEGT